MNPVHFPPVDIIGKTLIVYPKGNKKDGGEGQVSLYVQIDNSTLLNSPKEVYAEVKFFIYNRKEDKYLTYQETDPRRFFLFKPYFGQPRTKSYDEISNPDPNAGYNFDGDTNLFEFYVSGVFVIGGRSWTLKVYPSGDREAQGNSLSLYIVAAGIKPYEEIYLKAKLRILNQRDTNHVEKKVESWSDQENSWGFEKFVSFANLTDTSRGLLVNDTLKMEVEFEDFSNTKYFPS
ncbi:unnamed protein product [Arabidopsis arenosa]|uniref:MATH domain-containing protein n=1 Tax=Arabidopsis arenosa TaxID=38785 RepID=A0A8S2ABU0_ARAAE|nr:unnamed protein product [Arabidopsis arenosa]